MFSRFGKRFMKGTLMIAWEALFCIFDNDSTFGYIITKDKWVEIDGGLMAGCHISLYTYIAI